MLVMFPPIFLADTKIIYSYDFVAPLKYGAIFGGPVFYQFLLGENAFIREKLEARGLCGGLGGFRNKSLTSTAKHKCFRCVIVVNKTEIPKKTSWNLGFAWLFFLENFQLVLQFG